LFFAEVVIAPDAEETLKFYNKRKKQIILIQNEVDLPQNKLDLV
jgi:hypothetical protein